MDAQTLRVLLPLTLDAAYLGEVAKSGKCWASDQTPAEDNREGLLLECRLVVPGDDRHRLLASDLRWFEGVLEAHGIALAQPTDFAFRWLQPGLGGGGVVIAHAAASLVFAFLIAWVCGWPASRDFELAREALRSRKNGLIAASPLLVQTTLGLLLGGLALVAPSSLLSAPLNAIVLTGFLLLVVAPLTEEIILRGWIFRLLTPLVSPWVLAGLSAAVFTAAHAPTSGERYLILFAGALAMAWVWYRTRSLIVCIFAHFLINIPSFASYTWSIARM